MTSYLGSTSALELTQLAELPSKAYVSLLSIQKGLTLQSAATAPTLTGMVRYHGEATTVKFVCAVLKLYNDSLNTSMQMSARQLLETADLFVRMFPHDTLKDLILCLKRAKMGLYGADYNRIDSTVIGKFFGCYLAEKADWWEQQRGAARRPQQQAMARTLHEFSENVLTPDQRTELQQLTQRPFGSGVLRRAIDERTRLNPAEVTAITSAAGQKRMGSSGDYLDWLTRSINLLDKATLDELERSATDKNDQAVLAIVAREQHRRLTERD